MKIYEILPNALYQSAEFFKLPIREKLKNLSEFGIDIVVNLYKNEDKELEKHLFAYVYFPMPDGKTFDVKGVETLSSLMAQSVFAGHRVLTHCHAGRNRSGFVNAMALWKIVPGMTGRKALELVRERRPNAIDNPYFEKYLLNLMDGGLGGGLALDDY